MNFLIDRKSFEADAFDTLINLGSLSTNAFELGNKIMFVIF